MSDAQYAHYGDILTDGEWTVMFVAPWLPPDPLFVAIIMDSPWPPDGIIGNFGFPGWQKIDDDEA